MVRSSSGRALPGDDQPPVAEVDVVEMELPDGPGPGGVDGGQGDREAGGGVTAAEVAWSISAGCSGWMRIRGRWPSRTPRVGSRKIVPVFLQWPNSERKAVRVCRRRLAGQDARWRR